MAQISKIEWTESTWNPVTGCTKISSGCNNCYAERMALRLKAMGNQNYINGFHVTLHPHVLGVPLHWRQPRNIFVNSMSDLFHRDVPLEFILKVFHVMSEASQHRYQILTKRSRRLLQLNKKLSWQENIWMGVTVENDETTFRIDQLKQTDAKIKFISFEPLLSRIPKLDLDGIDWVIVGGESGPHARPMREEWVTEIHNQCLETGIPFFFKQWGGVNKKKAGRILDNQEWNEMPTSLRQQECVHA